MRNKIQVHVQVKPFPANAASVSELTIVQDFVADYLSSGQPGYKNSTSRLHDNRASPAESHPGKPSQPCNCEVDF